MQLDNRNSTVNRGSIKTNAARNPTVYYGNIKNNIALVLLSCNELNITQRFFKYYLENTKKVNNIYWIDNGSSDGTYEWLKEFSKDKDWIYLTREEKNIGIINGRNKGFDEFEKKDGFFKKCQQLLFLDNDQIVQKDWLEQYIDFFNKGYDIIGTEAWTMNDNFQPIRKVFSTNQPFNWVGCGGMQISRKAFNKIGKFDDIFNPCYFEDPDYCFRAHFKSLSIGWNSQSKIIHEPQKTNRQMQERGTYFAESQRKFSKKWSGILPPKFLNK